MTDSMAQLLAGAILLLVAGASGWIGYRIGRRRSAGPNLRLVQDDDSTRGRRQGPRRPPRPPASNDVVH